MSNNISFKIGGLELYFKPIPALISFLTFIGILLIQRPAELTSGAWMMFAIFIATIVAIIGKASVVGVVSLFGICLVAIFKATAPHIGADGSLIPVNSKTAIQDTLASYSNELIWLIVIAIFISRGIIKTRLGERIGYFFISIFGKRSIGIGYSLVICEVILAPLTPSNTARGGAIVHPIMKSISLAFESDPTKGTRKKIGKFLALINLHANSISSCLFVTSTAPNPLVVSYINEVAGTTFHLTWGTWALCMFLPGLLVILALPLIMYLLTPPEIKTTPNATKFAKEKLNELGPITKKEKIMISIFGLLLLFWADIPALIFQSDLLILNTTTTAFVGLFLLIITGILTWDEILVERSAWDTFFWFGALIMMAGQLNKQGVIGWLSDQFQFWLISMHLNSYAVFAILILFFLYSHYLFASTTAHITAMFLAFLIVGSKIIEPNLLIPFYLMMIASSTIMMGLTHYSTGTSPIIFGSGFITMGELWGIGFIMTFINIILFAIFGGIWWKILGLY